MTLIADDTLEKEVARLRLLFVLERQTTNRLRAEIKKRDADIRVAVEESNRRIDDFIIGRPAQ